MEVDPEPGAWLIKDIQQVSRAITSHRGSLETVISVATSMARLSDTRRSMAESAQVKQITYVALVFIPLSYVSSLFNMSEKVAPWSTQFWIYFAVALPLLIIVFALGWWGLPFDFSVRRFIRTDKRTKKASVGLTVRV
jgi:Mg2+ and Co2+ transporter CorA